MHASSTIEHDELKDKKYPELALVISN